MLQRSLQRLSPSATGRFLIRPFVPASRDAQTPSNVTRPMGFAGLGPLWRLGRSQPARKTASLGRVGSLEVRLARTLGEVRRAQALRFQVFYEEKSAFPDARTLATRRDFDAFDAYCDHVIVVDHDVTEPSLISRRRRPRIVGTYRVLRQSVAEKQGGFYAAQEYDIEPLLARHQHLSFVEMGRSCVLKPYRSKRTMELLWQGVWSYVLMHKADVMLGCASLEGTNPEALKVPLSYMHHQCRAPADWQVSALPERYASMNLMPAEEINPRAVFGSLPPLIKGYLRLGAYVGDGAVVDYQFNTTDVMILLPVARINRRYINYYGADASRHR